MSGPIRTEALIHDLAIVLRGCLHESAQVGPSACLAASRIRDVLGITPGELTAGIEDRLTGPLHEGGRQSVYDEQRAIADSVLAELDPHPTTSQCECGGIAHHAPRCCWREGYGSKVISDQREWLNDDAR